MTRKDIPSPSACIFDLDGTLVDSLRDIAEALNECLELLGVPPRPIDDYRYLVGEGVPTLCQRAIGATHSHLVQRLIELARPRYRSRAMRHTRPYAGIRELVARLAQRGVPLGVLSNKPHDMTTEMVRAFWPANSFRSVHGYTVEKRRKPDPTTALEMAVELQAGPNEIWLIGDTPIDVETAKRAGMVAVGVTWGFRPRADLESAGAAWIVDRPEELG